MSAQPPDRPGCPKPLGGCRPLPDPAAVRLFLVPDSAPPYDPDPSAGEPAARRLPVWPPGDGAAYAGEPGYRDRGSAEPGPGKPGPAEPGPAEPRPAEPRPGKQATPGVPPGWQSRFAQVLAETLAGARPPQQMVPWTTEETLDRIRRLGPQLASEQRPRVRRVVTSVPAVDVMEMAVVVGFGPRVRAMAVRLERSSAHPGSRMHPAARPGEHAAARWVCTAVEAA